MASEFTSVYSQNTYLQHATNFPFATTSPLLWDVYSWGLEFLRDVDWGEVYFQRWHWQGTQRLYVFLSWAWDISSPQGPMGSILV